MRGHVPQAFSVLQLLDSRRPIQSLFGNFIGTIGKEKHFSSRVAERLGCRPGAAGVTCPYVERTCFSQSNR